MSSGREFIGLGFTLLTGIDCSTVGHHSCARKIAIRSSHPQHFESESKISTGAGLELLINMHDLDYQLARLSSIEEFAGGKHGGLAEISIRLLEKIRALLHLPWVSSSMHVGHGL